MRGLRRVLWFAGALLLAVGAHEARGQESPWWAQSDRPLSWVDRSVGLSHNSVFEVLQDHLGYLWMGTIDGLNRYDGSVVHVFRNDPSDSLSLSNNTVRKLFLDRRNQLWIRTGVGLDRYVPEIGGFKRYPISVQEFYEDSEGTLWVTALEALYRYDEVRDRWDPVGVYPEIRSSPPIDSPTGITEGEDGVIWVLHDSGAIDVFTQEGRIVHQDSLLLEKPYLLPLETGVRAAISHSEGTAELDLRSGTLTLDPGGDLGVGVGFLTRQSQSDGGSWWGGQGIIEVELDGRQTQVWDGGGPGNLSTVWSLAEDDQGSLWAGTLRGVLYADVFGARFGHTDLLGDPWVGGGLGPVMGLAEAPGGDLYVGTLGQGLFRVDRRSGTPRRIEAQGVPAQIWALAADSLGRIWIGAEEGLAQFDPVLGVVRPDPSPGRATGRGVSVYTLAISPEQDVWAGTLMGLRWVDGSTGEVGVVPELWREPNGRNIVASVRVGRDGRVWVGTSESEIFVVDAETKSGERVWSGAETRFRGSEGFWASIEDSSGRPWFGGDRGLFLFDESSGELRSVGLPDGIPASAVFDMVPDDRDRLWLSTNLGVLRLDGLSTFPDRPLVVRQYEAPLVITESEFNRRAAVRTNDGSVLIGGMDGLTFFNPDQIRSNPTAPPVVVESLERITTEGVEILRPQPGESVTLNHDDAGLDIRFTAPVFGGARPVRYSVKMEGLDPDWFDPEGPHVRYMGVRPGDYTFRVRAASADGVWNEEGASLTIVIPPPFWVTPWFLILSALGGLAVVVLGVRSVSTRRLRAQLRALELERSVRAERDRISRDLHDHVGSQISGILSGLELARFSVNEGRSKEAGVHLAELDADARKALTDLRETVWSLHQESVTWGDLLERISEYFSKRKKYVPEMTLKLKSSGDPGAPISPPKALHLFRIVQEAVTNAIRHSGGSLIEVTLALAGEEVRLEVADDGSFQPEGMASGSGLGVEGMQERATEMAGHFGAVRNEAGGTTVQVVVPLSEL